MVVDTQSPSDKRRYIRHPTDIPILVELADVVEPDTEYLRNISEGGLCFQSKLTLARGTPIRIRIPLVRPVFECIGVVVWCETYGTHSLIGVQFERSEQIFRLRMVEQICHIEHYKRTAEKHGRLLTSEQAAFEWIERHAGRFPPIDRST